MKTSDKFRLVKSDKEPPESSENFPRGPENFPMKSLGILGSSVIAAKCDEMQRHRDEWDRQNQEDLAKLDQEMEDVKKVILKDEKLCLAYSKLLRLSNPKSWEKTKNDYNSWWHRYKEFCVRYGYHPVSTVTLAAFLDDLRKRERQGKSSLKKARAAVTHFAGPWIADDELITAIVNMPE